MFESTHQRRCECGRFFDVPVTRTGVRNFEMGKDEYWLCDRCKEYKRKMNKANRHPLTASRPLPSKEIRNRSGQ